MGNNMNSKKMRQGWLDLARVIAIISISSNHAIHRAFLDIRGEISLFDNTLRAIIQVFSRLGVPLFLMISGALLLSKRMENEKDIKRFYHHNLISILITTEIWYCIMFWFRTLGGANDFLGRGIWYTFLRFVETLLFLNQETFESMWYMPMILCIYLLIPWINLAVHKIKPLYIAIPITIVLLSSMIFENVNEYLAIRGIEYQIDFSLQTGNLFSMYVVFILLGYYVGNGVAEKTPTSILTFIFVCSFILSSLYQVVRYVKYDAGDIKYNFFFIALAGVVLFELVRRIHNVKHKEWVQYASRIAFGIYFVHIFIMTVLVKLPTIAKFSYMLKFAIFEFVSLGLSIAVIRLSATIPLLKKYLYLIK